MTDRIRILRIIEYVGPREWVEQTVARAVHGTQNFEVGGQITGITLREFGESIADALVPEVPRSEGMCERCGAIHENLTRVRFRPLYQDSYVERSLCRECLKVMQDGPRYLHGVGIEDLTVLP